MQNMQKNFKQVLGIFCGVGFVIGIIYENITHMGKQSGEAFLEEEALLQLMENNIVSVDFFFYVLRMRIRMLLPVCVIGLVKWKKIFVNLFLMWTGFLFGVFLAGAIIGQGIAGMLMCLVMLFPHMLFYIFGYYVILWNFYRYPELRWNARKIAVCVVAFLVGMLLETYINPWLVKGILSLM